MKKKNDNPKKYHRHVTGTQGHRDTQISSLDIKYCSFMFSDIYLCQFTSERGL